MGVGRFLINQWYVAATAREVAVAPLARTICNEALVLFRTQSGAVAALEDRCPHRMARLSMGEVMGEEIQCGYHGARFGANGLCTLIPSQKDLPLPKGFGARSFPVVEKFDLIFVWFGDNAKADPALIPQFFEKNTAPGWKAVHGYHHVKGNYQLVIDNLLDLSHVTYTHKSTLSGQGVDDVPMQVDVDGDVIRTSRVIRNVDPAPIHRQIKGLNGKIDRWQNSEFHAPTYVMVQLGAEVAGAFEKLVEPTHLVLNAATPETERTTHYFWSVTRPFDLENEELSRKFLEISYVAFNEDEAMIEQQQLMIDTAPASAALVNFRGDSAGVAARRVIRNKLETQ